MKPLIVKDIGTTPAVRDSLFIHRLRPLTVLGSTGAEYSLLIWAFLFMALAGAAVLVLL